jgi:hypothetical protein
VSYCKSKGGTPKLNGFNTWLKTWSKYPQRKSAKKQIPIAKRDKIINRLNEEKQSIYRRWPNGLPSEVQAEIDKINKRLAKL